MKMNMITNRKLGGHEQSASKEKSAQEEYVVWLVACSVNEAPPSGIRDLKAKVGDAN